jgi:hypothetical protein
VCWCRACCCCCWWCGPPPRLSQSWRTDDRKSRYTFNTHTPRGPPPPPPVVRGSNLASSWSDLPRCPSNTTTTRTLHTIPPPPPAAAAASSAFLLASPYGLYPLLASPYPLTPPFGAADRAPVRLLSSAAEGGGGGVLTTRSKDHTRGSTTTRSSQHRAVTPRCSRYKLKIGKQTLKKKPSYHSSTVRYRLQGL